MKGNIDTMLSGDRKATLEYNAVRRQKGNIGIQCCQETERQHWDTMLSGDRKATLGYNAVRRQKGNIGTAVRRQKGNIDCQRQGNIGIQYCQQIERQYWETVLSADRKATLGDSAVSG